MSDPQAVVYGFMAAGLIITGAAAKANITAYVKGYFAKPLRHMTIAKGEIVGGL